MISVVQNYGNIFYRTNMVLKRYMRMVKLDYLIFSLVRITINKSYCAVLHALPSKTLTSHTPNFLTSSNLAIHNPEEKHNLKLFSVLILPKISSSLS